MGFSINSLSNLMLASPLPPQSKVFVVFDMDNTDSDLVICDDVEDLNSVKTKEGRDKTFQWLIGEVMPIGDHNTKIIVVGNLLHEDCLLMRLRTGIDQEKLRGKFLEFPLVTSERVISWPGKFPDMNAIETLKQRLVLNQLGIANIYLRLFQTRTVSFITNGYIITTIFLMKKIAISNIRPQESILQFLKKILQITPQWYQLRYLDTKII